MLLFLLRRVRNRTRNRVRFFDWILELFWNKISHWRSDFWWSDFRYISDRYCELCWRFRLFACLSISISHSFFPFFNLLFDRFFWPGWNVLAILIDFILWNHQSIFWSEHRFPSEFFKLLFLACASSFNVVKSFKMKCFCLLFLDLLFNGSNSLFVWILFLFFLLLSYHLSLCENRTLGWCYVFLQIRIVFCVQ